MNERTLTSKMDNEKGYLLSIEVLNAQRAEAERFLDTKNGFMQICTYQVENGLGTEKSNRGILTAAKASAVKDLMV